MKKAGPAAVDGKVKKNVEDPLFNDVITIVPLIYVILFTIRYLQFVITVGGPFVAHVTVGIQTVHEPKLENDILSAISASV